MVVILTHCPDADCPRCQRAAMMHIAPLPSLAFVDCSFTTASHQGNVPKKLPV